MNLKRSLLIFALSASFAVHAQTAEYGDNYIIIEADDTTSDLGAWVKRQKGETGYWTGDDLEAIQGDYLEFTGNNLNNGNPNSPLTYTFVAPKTANYRMVARMLQPLGEDEDDDKRNDFYIRLEGNYTTECVYPKSILETDHKFWGRGVRTWGAAHNLEAHVEGNRTLAKVVYGLTAGEIYTFTVSGRAQGCSVDYFLFYEENLNLRVGSHVDIAAENNDKYQPSPVAIADDAPDMDEDEESTLSATTYDDQRFSIFPNPVTDSAFTIRGIQAGAYQLNIYNSNGQVVQGEELTISDGNQQVAVALPTGMYFATVSNTAATYTFKLIIK